MLHCKPSLGCPPGCLSWPESSLVWLCLSGLAGLAGLAGRHRETTQGGGSCLAAGTQSTPGVRGVWRSPGRSTALRTAREAARLARLESAGGRSLVWSPRWRQVAAAAGEIVGVGGSREEERETVECGVSGTQSKEMVGCSTNNNRINFLPRQQIYQVQHQNFINNSL